MFLYTEQNNLRNLRINSGHYRKLRYGSLCLRYGSLCLCYGSLCLRYGSLCLRLCSLCLRLCLTMFAFTLSLVPFTLSLVPFWLTLVPFTLSFFLLPLTKHLFTSIEIKSDDINDALICMYYLFLVTDYLYLLFNFYLKELLHQRLRCFTTSFLLM